MSGECGICGTWGCVEGNHDGKPPYTQGFSAVLGAVFGPPAPSGGPPYTHTFVPEFDEPDYEDDDEDERTVCPGTGQLTRTGQDHLTGICVACDRLVVTVDDAGHAVEHERLA